jgi:hypothetical protein
MHNELWSRDEPDSPCVKVCLVHREAGLCIGCLRRPAEIATWSRLSPGERQAILAELPGRRALFGQRRGGRAARLARKEGPE